MNLENKNDFVTNDIINDTKTLLKKDKCGDIWTRSCPKCHEQLTYNQIGHRNYHERKGSLCRTCCRIGKSYLALNDKENAKKIFEEMITNMNVEQTFKKMAEDELMTLNKPK